MARKQSAADRRKKKDAKKAFAYLAIVTIALGGLGTLYVRSLLSHKELDATTLCPAQPASLTIMLVDVTDPMNLPQRQDFNNQLDRLVEQVPRHGKIVVMKVDAVSEQLLTPIITRCNPGSAADVSEVDGNPQKLGRMHAEQFVAPLHAAFADLLKASGAPRSPILESIQSANLTELQKAEYKDVPRKLVVASDLLQHTNEVSFYQALPDADALIKGQPFSRARTDLRNVEVELWMLQRSDSRRTQPRALPDLWDRIITEQGGQLVRLYTVSG